MTQTTNRFKAVLFTIVIACICLFSKESRAQCTLSTSPSCLIAGQSVTITCSNSGGAVQVTDQNGTIVFSSSSPPFIFTPSIIGAYTIQYSGGFFGPLCNTSFYAINQPIALSVTTNSTTICTGGSIDYSSLGINITNTVGSITYNWNTSPNNISWTGLNPYPIPAGENSVTLTVTDDATGCSDSEIISLTYQSTNANASFVSSANTVSCPGEYFTFTANNIDTILYNYSWGIDGIPQVGGGNGMLTANILPNGSTVNITLFVEDINNGCIVQQSQTLNVSTPNYLAFDTTVSNYEQQLNAFTYCENDSSVIDTFYNMFTNTSGIDTVIIDNGFTQEIYTASQGFNNFFINVSESVYNIYVTTIFQGNCPPVTTTYDVLYNQTVGGLNVNFGTCSQSNLCIGDTVNYFIDPQQFQMSLNAVVHFVVKCNDNNIDTITWNYNDFQQNTYFTDADCNSLTPDVEKIVFPYLFEESSCGCYFYDDALGNIYDQYRIIPIFETYCDTMPMTLGLLEYVPPNPTATFLVPDSMCPGATATIQNNSSFGCTNPESLDPNYNPSNANYSQIQPTFYYDWGNCSSSSYTPTQSQYNSNNYLNTTNTYNKPGIYHIELAAINTCDTITYSDSITIFPQPNVSFTSNKVCLNEVTSFINYSSSALETKDTISCIPEDIIINIPLGFPIASYFWNMGANTGQYVNGTSSASENPEYIFNSCGEHIVSLTAIDSLGCDSIYTDTVIIYDLPIPNFTTNNVCEGNPTCVNDLSQYNQNNNCFGFPINTWQWEITDNNGISVYSNTDNSSTNFCDTLSPLCDSSTISFDYEITLTLTDSYGCSNSTSETTTIYCQPIADFDSSGVCIDSPNGGTKYFNNTSSPQSGMSWKWYFGDGDSSNAINPAHTYTNTGLYNVTLILIGPNCNDTITHQIEVWENATITHIDSNIFCFGDNSGSIDITMYGGIAPFNFLWSGPNGFSSNTEDVNNLFAGTYYLQVLDNNGCLSYDTIIITENNLITGTSLVDTCDTYNWNGQTITNSGNYNQTFTNSSGCDSVHTLVVTIRYSSTSTSTIDTCDNYTWNNITYNTSGTYSWTGINSVGCDSTATLNLIIRYSNTGTSLIDTCDVYSWNGQTITTSGNYNQTFTNIAGCDSVHTLAVTIRYSNTGTSLVDTCDTYSWNGQTITTSGNYNQTFTNSSGCDSVHTLVVTIRYSSTSTSTIDTCDNYTWNNITYNTSGTYSWTGTNSVGCDSTATLNLIIRNSNTGTSNIDTCDTYNWNGQTITNSGNYNQTFTNSAGCDSVHTLAVTIRYSNTGTSLVDTCDTYSWNGQTITNSGNYNQTFTNSSGCDSVHTLVVTIRYSSTSTSTIDTCDNYTWNNITYNTSGTYSWTGTNSVGCDSTATLNLIIRNSNTGTSNIDTCDTYNWNGQTITNSGNYNQTFTNSAGCDSVHTLAVTIRYSNTGTSLVDTCDTYNWNGQTITNSGNYNQTFTNSSGCDSVHTLVVTIRYSSTSTSTIDTCDNYTWNNITYNTSGTYSWTGINSVGCDSTATLNLIIRYSNTGTSLIDTCDVYSWNGQTITTSGNYNQTFTNIAGCDSVHTLIVTIRYSNTGTSLIDTCDTYNWNGQIITTSGNYNQTFTNSSGCDSVHTLVVTIRYSSTSNTIIDTCDNYTWNNTTYNTSGTYSWTGINSVGCDSTATLNLIINNSSVSTIEILGSLSNCATLYIDSSLVIAVDSLNPNNNFYNWIITHSNGTFVTGTGINPPIDSIPNDNDSVSIQLIVTNNFGCHSDTSIVMVYTIEDPIAIFTISDSTGCHPLTVNTDTTGTTQNANYNWHVINQVGDTVQTYNSHQNSFTLTNTSNTTDSTYIIVLTVGDIATNCDSTLVSDTITVYHNPDALFNLSNTALCAPNAITATDISITGDVLSYIWTTVNTTPTINNPNSNSTTIDFIDNQTGASNFYAVNLLATDTRGCIDTVTHNVELWTRPIANFNIDSLQCGPDTLIPNNQSQYATGNSDFIWNILSPATGWNINNINDSTPQISFEENTTTDSINYIIELTAITENGCTDITTDTVTIFPTPLVSFNPSTNIGCGPLTVNLANTSNPYNGEDTTTMSFSWHIDGILQTGTTNFTYTFPAIFADTICYTIVLVGNTQHGCTSSDTTTICVYPEPIAELNLNSVNCFCAPLEINTLGITAIDYPQANIGINWTVVNSSGNTVQTGTGLNCPTYNITAQNDYVWIYIDAYNDCDTVQDSIYVCTIEDPIAIFTISDSTGCHPLTVNTDTTGTTQNANYNWHVINQVGDTVQTYNSHQNSFTLTNTSNTTDSTYIIVLTVGDIATNCDSTLVSDTITVYHNPDALFNLSNTALCAPNAITATDISITGDVLSYIWTTVNTTPTINNPNSNSTTIDFIDNQTGASNFYAVNLLATDTRGCIDTVTHNVELWTRPIANFNIDSLQCGPDTLIPNNQSQYATGNSDFIWNILSPATGWNINNINDSTPQISFEENTTTDSINYIIELTAITENGCTDITTDTVTIFPTPLVSFNPSTNIGCGPLTVNLANTSNPYNGEDTTTMSFSWHIDGILQTGTTNFTYTFPAIFADTICYTIVLVGNTQHGCTSSDTTTICVYPEPIAELNLNSVNCFCAPLEINTLGITAIDYPQANIGINWTVVNSSGNTVQTGTGLNCPTYNITAQNDYVWIYIDAYNDCDTVQDSIYVCTIEDPIAIFTISDSTGCHPLTVNTDTTGTTQNANYNWHVINQVGDTVQTYNSHQNSFTLTNTSNTTDSTYIIVLTVGDIATNCDSTLVSDTITVYHNPDALFNLSNTALCAPNAITATDISITGDVLSYIWTTVNTTPTINNPNSNSTTIDFIDNQTGASNFYAVNLLATDTRGCIDTVTHNVELWTRPIANFNIDSLQCGPDTLIPNNQSQYATGNSDFIWNILSPATGWNINNINDSTPQISFEENTTTDSINYIIELTAITENGCTDITTDTVTIFPTPLVSFNPSTNIGCGPLTVNLANTSNPYNGEDTTTMSFSWHIDGILQTGTTNFTYTFPAIFADTICYTIVLVGNTQHGCTSSDTTTICVYPEPIAELNLNSVNCFCAPLEINTLGITAIDYPQANIGINWTVVNSSGNTVQTGTGLNCPTYNITAQNDYVWIYIDAYNDCDTVQDSIYVCTIEDPIAIFTISDSTGCHPLTVNTDTTGTTQNANYNWHVINQVGDTVQTYNSHQNSFTLTNTSNTTDSTYIIVLTVGDIATNCDSTLVSDTITVYPIPVANIQLTNVCDSTETNFVDISTPTYSSLTNWEWNFGDTLSVNDTSIIQNPNPYIYTTWGQWNVELIITDLNGCKDTTDKQITIYPNPSVSFDTVYNCFPDSICANEIIVFNDNSSIDTLGGVITNQYWFIDNTLTDSSSYNNPYSISFNSGLHSVKYLVKSEYGCIDSITNTIQVVEIPVAKFNIVNTICVNDTNLYVDSNLSTGYILDYYWEIKDSSGIVNWSDSLTNNSLPIFPTLMQGLGPVTYYISLTVSNCCGDSTYTDSIVILPTPQVLFVTNPICDITPLPVGSPINLTFNNFIDTLNTDSVIIKWGDGTNSGMIYPDLSGGMPVWQDLSHSYGGVGSFNICLTGYNQCDSTTYCCTVNIIPNQISSNFQVIQNYPCYDDSCGVKLWELSSPGFPNATVNWWFNYNPNLSPNYPFLSSPDLSIPYNQFDTICWKYPAPGVYLILHEISAGPIGGPTGPTFKDTTVNWLDTIIVYPKPETILNCNNVCLFDTVTFINNSTINNSIQNMPNQQIVNWQWNIDGINISSPWDLTYSFNSPGLYWIKLETWSNYGCYDVDSCQITVFDLPTAGFTVLPDSSCFGLDSTRFIADIPTNSQNGSGNIINWTWNFNGTIEGPFISDSRNHLFGSPGNKIVSLILEDDNGCTDIFIDTINLIPGNTASFSWDTVCFGNATVVNGSFSSSGTDLWEWDFNNDGITDDYGISSSYTFPSNGVYPVTLTTYKYLPNDTCSDFITLNVYIWDLPEPNFTVADSCFGDKSAFINLSNPGADANLLSSPYSWVFYDNLNSYSTNINPEYTFNSCGAFSSKLIITDNNLCQDSITLPLTVACPPSSGFIWDTTVCNGTVMCFTDTSSEGSNNINQWDWTIVGGSYQSSNQTVQNPCYLFDSCGTNRLVNLKVTDVLGCINDTTIYVDVHCNPTAIINNIIPVCQGDSTYFTNSSIIGDVPLTSFYWDYGDFNYSTNYSTANLYSLCNDNYIITLSITDENYCTDIDSSVAIVNCNPIPNFNYSINSCQGDSTYFNDNSLPDYQFNSTTTLTNWYWNFDSYSHLSNSTSDTLAIMYDSCGNNTFPVSLTVTDSQSPACSSTETKLITVHCNPVAIITTDTVCQNFPTTLNSISLSGGTDSLSLCNWSLIDGSYENGFTPNMCSTRYDFDTCGQQNYILLTVTNNAGCIDTDSIMPYIWCNPIADFSISNIRCKNTPIQLNSQAIGIPATIDSWLWDFGINSTPSTSILSSQEVIYSTIFNPQNITFIAGDINNCYDTITKFINVHENPTANFNATNVCHSQPTEFTNTTMIADAGILNYYWNMIGNGTYQNTTNSSSKNPSYIFNSIPSNEGAYVSSILIVEDSLLCRDTITKISEIHPIPEIQFIAPDICEGINEIFINTSIIPGVNWVFNDGPWYGDTVWIFNGDYLDYSTDSFFFNNSYSPGVYNLSLNIETTFISDYNNQHCKNTYNEEVEILVMPKIDPDTNWTNNQCGTDVEFTFNGNPSNVHNWSYYINDPHNSNYPITNTHNLSYQFNYPGIYSLLQVIENNNGCYDSIVDYLHIYPSPIANFTPDIYGGCEELEVNFINNSFIQFDSLYNGGISEITTYNWVFGNGEISPFESPSILYNTLNGQISNFIPTLYIETDFGCSDYLELTDSLTIYPTPKAEITTPILNIGPGKYLFNGQNSKTSSGTTASPTEFDYIWATNNDSIWNKLPTPDLINYQYQSNSNFQGGPEPILYDVCLILIDKESQFQCSDTFCINPGLYVDYFKGLYVPNALAPNGNSGEPAYFLPKGKSLKAYHLEIFDTWGNLVWETSAITKLDGKPIHPWKGNTLDDKPLSQGTYVWKIYAKFSDDSIWPGINGKATGPIYLIR